MLGMLILILLKLQYVRMDILSVPDVITAAMVIHPEKKKDLFGRCCIIQEPHDAQSENQLYSYLKRKEEINLR